ncbi:hypothetical protein PR202_gb29336 [Eleusine coracana subsp. coracana]|uniref:Uncharacterized protein n=1 Tax=Eleusine coracana subsp. coracana TaxID=191504 RepID=A0AAV5FZ46_ELECO|nr:hypothetical protein PR202_gb29336 [Eleusine coracana subsp. coracana]
MFRSSDQVLLVTVRGSDLKRFYILQGKSKYMVRSHSKDSLSGFFSFPFWLLLLSHLHVVHLDIYMMQMCYVMNERGFMVVYLIKTDRKRRKCVGQSDLRHREAHTQGLVQQIWASLTQVELELGHSGQELAGGAVAHRKQAAARELGILVLGFVTSSTASYGTPLPEHGSPQINGVNLAVNDERIGHK